MPSRLFAAFASGGLLAASLFGPLPLAARESAPALTLPPIFSNHMVVQSGQPLIIHGRAAPRQEVRVTWSGKAERTTSAAETGSWSVELPAPMPGGPHTLTVAAGAENTITVEDILAGEVWLAGGDAQMSRITSQSADAQEEIAGAVLPALRIFETTLPQAKDAGYAYGGSWRVVTPESVPKLSAMAYFFGRQIHRETGWPVGIIDASYVPTRIREWIPLAVLEDTPAFKDELGPLRRALRLPPEEVEDIRREQSEITFVDDPGNRGYFLGYAFPEFDDSDWDTLELPRMFDSAGLDYDGATWVRRRIRLPETFAGKPLVLELGSIDDYDVTYFNGFEIGSTGPEVQNAWRQPRTYTAPADIVSSGPNVIAIRVWDHFGLGGFNPGNSMRAYPEDEPAAAVELSGTWRVKASIPIPSLGQRARRWNPLDLRKTGEFFRTRVATLAGFGLRGIVWAQGEGDLHHPADYRTLFPLMIRAWREALGNADLPFFFIQLPAIGAPTREPGPSRFAEFRSAQMAALELPEAAMAAAADLPDPDNTRFPTRQTIASRLARIALARNYGQDLAYRNPRANNVDFHEGRIVVEVAHAGPDGLRADNPAALEHCFAVAGPDGEFRWAPALLSGPSTVEISVPPASRPATALRYGWSRSPRLPITGSQDLPLLPFERQAPAP